MRSFRKVRGVGVTVLRTQIAKRGVSRFFASRFGSEGYPCTGFACADEKVRGIRVLCV